MTELLDMEVRAVATAWEVVEDADVLLSVTNSNVPTQNVLSGIFAFPNAFCRGHQKKAAEARG
jgi:hypothetical protein